MPQYDENEGQTLLKEAMATGTHEGQIERAELQGQKDLAASNDLPILMHSQGGDITREQVTAATGIQFGNKVNALFVEAILPEGWTKELTNSYTSYLLDQHGRQRARLFYKAAHYDRRADMTWLPFLTFQLLELPDGARQAAIIDGNRLTLWQGTLHKETRTEGGAAGPAASTLAYKELEEARAWATANGYPAFEQPFAYWDTAPPPAAGLAPPSVGAIGTGGMNGIGGLPAPGGGTSG